MRLFLRRLQKGTTKLPLPRNRTCILYIAITSLLWLSACGGQIKIEEVRHLNRDHFQVSTPEMTLLYDRKGGGFSSIIDPDGNDWVNFGMEPWDEYPASAGSSFRGLPNFVYGSEASGAGHPGHDQCLSQLESSNSILTSSLNDEWKWLWSFREGVAKVDILATDPNHPYWFLYEGTPGGVFEPESQFFGTSRSPHPNRTPFDYFNGDKLFDEIQWAYFGYDKSEYVLLILQITEDEHSDTFSYLGNTPQGVNSSDGMVVFGFGRGDGAKPLMTEKNSFIFKFVSIDGIDDIGQYISAEAEGLL